MNSQESDILQSLLCKPFVNQRILAEQSGHSLGVVNKSLKHLTEDGYLDENMQLTPLARKMFEKCNHSCCRIWNENGAN